MHTRLTGLCITITMMIAANLSAKGEEAMQVKVEGYQRTTLYHSPQTPGFTCWASIWKMPDKSVMVSFTQATGPAEGWRARAPSHVRERLCWPPTGREGYDMTGLALENVHLRSTDGGKTWTQVSADPFASCMNACDRQGKVALPDGTILRVIWGQYLPFWDVPQTGYIQRSNDGTKTWGPPELLLQDKNIQAWPSRLRMLSDGRLVITGAIVPYDSEKWIRYELLAKMRSCIWVSKDKAGKTWSEPIYAMLEPPEEYWLGVEFDVAELDNGDLLAVYRLLTHDPQAKKSIQVRRQNVLVKKGETWEPTPIMQAPFSHSGHPELLRTREGLVLHIATNGTWWTADRGAHWTHLDLPGTGYYPRSVQLDDGTIIVVGHVGSDNAYGATDQSIVMDTYRLVVNRSSDSGEAHAK